MSIKEAYAAELKMAADYKAAYIARSSESDCAKKHFDIGYDGYYGSKAHKEMLATFGFDSVDSFNDACRATTWFKAYEKFNKIASMLDYNSVEWNNIRKDLIAENLYCEEDMRLMGEEMYAICKKHAPKQCMLFDVAEELGYSTTMFGERIHLNKE